MHLLLYTVSICLIFLILNKQTKSPKVVFDRKE